MVTIISHKLQEITDRDSPSGNTRSLLTYSLLFRIIVSKWGNILKTILFYFWETKARDIGTLCGWCGPLYVEHFFLLQINTIKSLNLLDKKENYIIIQYHFKSHFTIAIISSDIEVLLLIGTVKYWRVGKLVHELRAHLLIL